MADFQTIPASRQGEQTRQEKKRKYPVYVGSHSLSFSSHPSLSSSLSAQTVPFCALQGKYRMPWTDLSFLKDCWHLSSAHLKLLLAHFCRAHTCRGAGASRKCLLLNLMMKTGETASICPSSMHSLRSDFEELSSTTSLTWGNDAFSQFRARWSTT